MSSSKQGVRKRASKASSQAKERRPMNGIYHEKARRGEEGIALLQQTTAQLKDVFDPYSDQVEAEWDQVKADQGRLLYTLKLRDLTGEVEGRFVPDELTNPVRLRFTLSACGRSCSRSGPASGSRS
jgi:hypothetical protein